MTRGDEYAVQAFAADGTARWIVHVEQPVARATEPGPPAMSLPAGPDSPGVGHPLRVDGSGNLYVFPYADDADDRGRVPVDVYSPAGDRLFAGWIERRSWLHSAGPFAYGIEGEEGSRRVVRYRLQAPFATGIEAARKP